ncbi:hypothetical protein COO60DRAFT_485137 [Scenedesmus sp. NREL 46B-D3]|nr:hypothetical protein COO60DRAFT_485137 [Scenedesmus sp. NREL 46B-D3]
MAADRWQDVLAELRQCDYQQEEYRVRGILDTALAAADSGGMPDATTPASVLQQLAQARQLYDSDRAASWGVVERVLADVEDAQALLMLMAAPPADASSKAAAAAGRAAVRLCQQHSCPAIPAASGAAHICSTTSAAVALVSQDHSAAAAPSGHAGSFRATFPASSCWQRSRTVRHAARPALVWPPAGFPAIGCPGRVQCRQILAAAADAADADAAACAAGVGLLLRQLLALQDTQLGPADVVEAVCSLLNQVVSPATVQCSRCGVMRLLRQQVSV